MTDRYPQKIYAELTTRCNLQCPMCVKYATGSCIEEKDMDLDLFRRLAPALPHAHTLILNGIGESLLHPQLEQIIRLARTKMTKDARIGLQSNGFLLDQPRAKGLLDAGLSTICLSVDNLSTQGLESSEMGHAFPVVARAVAALDRARLSTGNDFTIGLEMVLARNTIGELPDVVRWAAANGVDYIIATHLFPYGGANEQAGLFNPHYREAVEIFNTYNRMAAEMGMDLASYLATYLSLAKTPTDHAMLQLVAEMRRVAEKRDVHLNLKGLLEHVDPDLPMIEDLFQTTKTIAQTANIQLFLPPLQAESPRSCPFVSENATFISGSGDVMPCHFLWHTYACRVRGEDIPVQERVFGNLYQQSLAEIWQGAEYHKFREEANADDYASCWGCSLGPCSPLINDNQYANDCYGSSVPCGHCLWSLGGIRCL
ncbi:MAG: radical SAM/SPASM family putative metalloenzyme maturase [Desulforhopalus sp.]|nr:radical SAM/SPASM family putative metalloenzyme maturase [Desulforhopalus sp.]